MGIIWTLFQSDILSMIFLYEWTIDLKHNLMTLSMVLKLVKQNDMPLLMGDDCETIPSTLHDSFFLINIPW